MTTHLPPPSSPDQLDAVSRDLDARRHAAQWVMTDYLLALAFALPGNGELVDRIGNRRVFLLAVLTFAAASAACAAAPGRAVLVALRVR